MVEEIAFKYQLCFALLKMRQLIQKLDLAAVIFAPLKFKNG